MSDQTQVPSTSAHSHALRRGVATVAGGTLVLGAGAAVGVMTASISSDWQGQQVAARQAQADAAEPIVLGDMPVRRPVVVTEIIEEHVAGEPVVVYRTVTEQAPAPRAQAVAPQRQQNRAPAKPNVRRRTTVAPAPRAPVQRQAPARRSTTSKSS